MTPHLLRCQWIGVGHYTLNIGRLEAGAPSTFAHSGFQLYPLSLEFILSISLKPPPDIGLMSVSICVGLRLITLYRP